MPAALNRIHSTFVFDIQISNWKYSKCKINSYTCIRTMGICDCDCDARMMMRPLPFVGLTTEARVSFSWNKTFSTKLQCCNIIIAIPLNIVMHFWCDGNVVECRPSLMADHFSIDHNYHGAEISIPLIVLLPVDTAFCFVAIHYSLHRTIMHSSMFDVQFVISRECEKYSLRVLLSSVESDSTIT